MEKNYLGLNFRERPITFVVTKFFRAREQNGVNRGRIGENAVGQGLLDALLRSFAVSKQPRNSKMRAALDCIVGLA
jgi:hypothetical protein